MLIVKINGGVNHSQVRIAAVAVECFVDVHDAVGVTHPSVPMLIARTLQRMLRVVRFALALRGLVLGHRLQRTQTEESLLAVLRRRVALRHNAEQLALSAAVGLPFSQLYFLNVHIKIKSYLRGKFGFLR